MKGIGYQEYKLMREAEEGLTSSKMELPGNERFLIYFGRMHLIDHETGIEARAALKIGRGKYATAIMRGRNQPGGDFRIYNEILFETNTATNKVETLVSNAIFRRKIFNTVQGQDEMYNYLDSELPGLMQFVAELIEEHSPYYISEINAFEDNVKQVIPFTRNENKKPGYVLPTYSVLSEMFG